MTDQKVEVFIVNSQRIVVERLTEWNSLTCVSRFNKTGSWELELSSDLWVADYIDPSSGILVTLDGTTLFMGIGGIEFSKSNEILRLAGTDLNVYLENPTRPTPSLAEGPYPDEYNVQTGIASSVMRGVVFANFGVIAPAEWIVDGLTFAGDPLLGSTVTARTRFDPAIILLAELASSPVAGGLGFRLRNADAGVTNAMFFDVYQPQDKHAEIKFGVDLHTAKSYEWIHQQPSANYFIVGGGDAFGIDRTIVEGGDAVSIAEVGRRIAKFVDKRGVTDLSELEQELAQLIAGAISTNQVTVTPTDTQGYRYLEDYNLGDYVSAIVGEFEFARIIREVEMSFQPNEGPIFRPVIADPLGTNDDILARHLDTLQNRISNIERNWTVPQNSIIEDMLHESMRWYPGDMKMTGRAAAQNGWLICDGSAISRSTYSRLFASIGTLYGIGNGSTTFNIPDYRDRVNRGAGLTHAVGANGGSDTYALGTHTHSHSHTMVDHNHSGASHTHIGSHSHPQTIHSHGPGTHQHNTDIAHAHASVNTLTEAVFSNLGGFGPTSTVVNFSHDHNVTVPALGLTSKTSGAPSAVNTDNSAAVSTGIDSNAPSATYTTNTGTSSPALVATAVDATASGASSVPTIPKYTASYIEIYTGLYT